MPGANLRKMYIARWIRIVALAFVAVALITVVAALDDGTSAYVLSALGVFVVVALGTPLALMHPRTRAPAHAAVAR